MDMLKRELSLLYTMRYKTYSEDYETERINYPEKWDFECLQYYTEYELDVGDAISFRTTFLIF